MKFYFDELKWYNKLELHLGAVFLLFMLALLFFQIILRYFFDASISWISEYSLYMFMYFVFLSCSGSFLRNDHIQIVVFINKLPAKYKSIYNLFLYTVNLAFVLIITCYCFVKVRDQYALNAVSITQFPLWIMSASLFFGMLASSIRCLMNIYLIIKNELKISEV